METHRSPLKWPGGKGNSIGAIKELLNRGNNRSFGIVRENMPVGGRLWEPFVGGGSVFLNADHKHCVISDTNADLMSVYSQLKNNTERFIERCQTLFTSLANDEETYYMRRDSFNKDDNHELDDASLFVYLNRHCFNGLVRYNQSGEFNSPFGKYKTVYFPEAEMRYAAERLKHTMIMTCDFEEALNQAMPGDCTFMDPPFIPSSVKNGFTTYTPGGFGMNDHARLVQAAVEARDNGISVLVCNHDCEATRSLYSGADEIVALSARRNISCNGSNRKPAQELMALYKAR